MCFFHCAVTLRGTAALLCATPEPPYLSFSPFFRSLLPFFSPSSASLSSPCLYLPPFLYHCVFASFCLALAAYCCFPWLSLHTQDKDMIDQGRWPAPGSVSSNNFDQAAINRKVCALNRNQNPEH